MREELISSPSESGEYLLSQDYIDKEINGRPIARECVCIYFRKSGYEEWEHVRTLDTWPKAIAATKRMVAHADKQAKLGSKKLTYDVQLDFKKWALKFLRSKSDSFYFDYVTGVDSKTSKDIPGLVADGSLTWEEALRILENHFIK